MSTRVAVQDCLYLTLIITLSFVLYVWGLGFYTDDWAFLGLFSNAKDQSLLGLIREIFPHTAARPVQSVYLASLYWLFGLDPFLYHLINNLVFITAILLFYLSLRELGLPRLLTLSVPLVFALLPHYSTDRFWFATFQINLSLGLYFLSLYADLRVALAKQARGWRWKTLAILALVGSVLAYEVVAPLFLLNPVLVRYQARRLGGPISVQVSLRKNLYLQLASNLLVLGLVFGYKVVHTDRVHIRGDYLSHISSLVKESIILNYGGYGFRLPLKVERIVRNYPNRAILAIGISIGFIVFSYLYRSISYSLIDSFSKVNWLKLIAIGLSVSGLGYGVFLTTTDIGFTETGISNRTAIAAALGVALSFVGIVGFVSSLMPYGLLRRIFFCLLITLVCVSGFIINNTIAQFWVAASSQQQKVILAVRQQFLKLPPETTLILDGICPYIGPGIVFETNWDVGGMLQVYYRDPTLMGDVVTQRSEIKKEGLYTSLYSDTTFYPYSEKLIIYHLGQNKHYQLNNAEAAFHYFRNLRPSDHNCPKGTEGAGTKIF